MVDSPQTPGAPLRVGMVTTWGTHCGIATYAEELVPALERHLEHPVAILAEAGPGTMLRREGDARPAEACWSRYRPQGNAAAIEQVIRRHQLTVLHIQHEFGLWPNDTALQETIRAAQAAGARVVVTLHTVFPAGGYYHSGTLQMVGARADAVVVHGLQAMGALLAAGARRVSQISHGTTRRVRGNREAGLDLLGVPPALAEKKQLTWGLVFGFQAPGKNIIGTLRAFAQARATKQLSNCGLLICGEVKDDFYGQRVNGTAMETGYLPAIYKHDNFVGAKLADVFAAADFGILNHLGGDPAVLSASGQAHLYASFGVPLACADAPIYSDAINAGFAVPFQLGRHVEEPTLSAANAIAALGSSAPLRHALSANALTYARETEWSHVAGLLLDVYEGATDA